MPDDDLQHLWASVPVGPTPVTEVLRRTRRRRRRAVGATASVTAVAAAVALVTVLPGGVAPSGPVPTAGGDLAPVAYHGELRSGESCEALLDHYVERALPHVTSYGWDRAVPTAMADGATNLRDLSAAAATLDRLTEQSSSDTGTNVQEAGVDEPDRVKTDGRTLWRTDGDVLTSYDVTGDEPDRVSSLDLGTLPGVDDLGDAELLLSGTTLVAVGGPAADPLLDTISSYLPVPRRTEVLTLDVSDPAAPRMLHVATLDAAVAVRQHGSVLRVVTSTGLPSLDLGAPVVRRGSAGQREALRANRELVRRTTLDDWLPTVSVDGGDARPLLPCDEVAVPSRDLGAGTVSVVGLDLADAGSLGDPGAWARAAVAAEATTAYASTEHVYLAAVEHSRRGPQTHLFDFRLEGRSAAYVGAGWMPGVVADRWAMDEHDDVLRVAVARGGQNAVVTLRADGDALRRVGRVTGIGPDESITAVRWFDDLAVVVTFRQVDPLYSVDLSDPARPRVVGVLKVPGFSSYLHPVGDDRLLGIGEGPQRRGWGAQVGLFDVADLRDPTRLDAVDLGRGSYALATSDPRAFTWLPDARTALAVVSGRRQGGRIVVLRVDDDTVRKRTVDLDVAADQVRTVPLTSSRVVVSWRGGGRFLDLG